ncbi:MAG: butyrate kinase [Spirochaetes bacterium]|uniref:Probable butyrate kinase n=1 Tax=Candidatus Aphodenecus pullistercoris TaxID=2840669 RepID=A0A9D9EAM1_9SPIR|nr:butyrate kinase [Candidatus Aphodenecus pullistercoris]
MRILVINPGSTSTKISVYDDEAELFTQSVFHDAPQLLQYPTTNDQLPMRRAVVEDLLRAHGIPMDSIDVFVGRGGCAYSQKAGVMRIDQRLVDDTRDDKGGSDHPAKLGVMLAWQLAEEYGRAAFTLDPTNVDEYDDVARITGIKGVYRRAQSHVLNQKGIARIHAAKLGRSYEECSFIVCHIDGGITVAAHRNGRMVDGSEGAGGEGAFTPTRLGSIPVLETVRCLSKCSVGELEAMCSRSGGFVSHFGTSSADKVHELASQGDGHARLVWQAMCYQIAKSIGSMACVLCGKVDAILLTGGLVRFQDIVDYIEAHCAWIAPICVYPGEIEQEVLAGEVLRVMRGEAEARDYTGQPVFSGFSWDGQAGK